MTQISSNCPHSYNQPQYSCNAVKIDIHNPQANMPLNSSKRQTMQSEQCDCQRGSVYAQNPVPYPKPYIPQKTVAAPVSPIVTASQVANNPAVVVPVATPIVTQTVPAPSVKPVVVDDTVSKIKTVEKQSARVVVPTPVIQQGPQQIINNNIVTPVVAPKGTMNSVDQEVVANTIKANDSVQKTADNVSKQNIVKNANIVKENKDVKIEDKPKVEIKPSEDLSARLRGDFVARLKSDDLDVQSKALIEIASATQQLAEAKRVINAQDKKSPEFKQLNAEYNKAFDSMAGVVLDEKVVESVIATLVKDTSNLEGPTPKQIELRTKEMKGGRLSDDEKLEAYTLSPMEKGEQNKEFALFTLRLIQEMYMEGIEKMTGNQPDLKDVPGVEQMIVTIKSNPNPAVRVAGISALTHNARPQDKEVLNTVLRIAAEQDSDESVRNVAALSLERINNPVPAQKAE